MKILLFFKLADLKLVSIIPRFGTRLNPIDNNESPAAFEAEIKLEGFSGSLAAEKVAQDQSDELRTFTDGSAQLLNREGTIRHRPPIPGRGKE